jgi:hypothetical protein
MGPIFGGAGTPSRRRLEGDSVQQQSAHTLDTLSDGSLGLARSFRETGLTITTASSNLVQEDIASRIRRLLVSWCA